MSHIQQDQIINDEENELCPLCIEEFDLSDRNFHPCPCGYQICQFCYNNIKTTMNGLCPACRRQYDDDTIQWKVASPEEVASYKENLAQQQKKRAVARQKEAQKREADSLSRKHLAGIRVRQKNLVYVTGFKPTVSENRLADTLRGHDFFGQYGSIIKVVVSKSKESTYPHQSVGVYVTFERREDAASCIKAVDGTQNEGTRLRAQYGTTKYCSAYLRHETCNNRECMFLHEPGEENESFSRQDLSSMNVISTQSPSQANMPSTSQPPQPQPPPQYPPQTIAAAAQPMDRHDNKDESTSPVDSSDGSALPSTASWANRNAQSRRTSRAPSAVDPSPLESNALPLPDVTQPSKGEPATVSANLYPATSSATRLVTVERIQSSSPLEPAKILQRDPTQSLMKQIRSVVGLNHLQFNFDEASVSSRDLQLVNSYPLLFDLDGGAKRHLTKSQEAEHSRQENDKQVVLQALSALDLEESAEGGSLQLGGEPEERHELGIDHQPHAVIQPPTQVTMTSPVFGLEQAFSPSGVPNLANHGRSMLSQQQQQYLLQQFKSDSPAFLTQAPLQSNSLTNIGPSHARQTSRFSFANDSASASASVKPVTNPKLMNQQSSMMPPTHIIQHSTLPQLAGNQFFSSGIQGPPPGLKTTGTPPVSGGGMFGQGHGFATAGLGYSINTTRRNHNDDMLHELLRARGSSGGSGPASDAGRREFTFPSFLHQHSSQSSSPAPTLAPGFSSFPYRPQPGAYYDHGLQKHKKKGKKHRHANTSSSGGGVVDLADPSTLQARMHQASTTGHGFYGVQSQGQGQDDSRAFSSVGSLQDDSFVSSSTGKASPNFSTRFQHEPRRGTSALPPGMSMPFQLSLLEQISGVGQHRQEVPRIPGLGDVPISLPSSPGHPEQLMTSVKSAYSTFEGCIPTIGILNDGQVKVKENLTLVINNAEDVAFPALPKSSPAPFIPQPKTKVKDSSTRKENRMKWTVDKDGSVTPTIKGHELRSFEDVEILSITHERPHPEKADIGAGNKSPGTLDNPTDDFGTTSKAATPSRSARESSTTPSLVSRPGTPGFAPVTPVKRAKQPRTIRVLATPTSKTILPVPPGSGTSTSVPPPLAKPSAVVSRHHSRQPSLSSITIPGSPTGEKLSDNASMTTESISRASSPIPTRAGSAATRVGSKSQQKKERQERVKEDKKATEPEVLLAPVPIMQEPIMGRKKKTKKTGGMPTATSTPVPSRPTSPVPNFKRMETLTVEELTPATQATVAPPEPVTVADATSATSSGDRREAMEDAEPIKKSVALPASIIADLQASGDLDPSGLELFKTATGLAVRHDITTADLGNVAPPARLSEDELATLEDGQSIRRHGIDGRTSSRLLVTPSRKCLRGLTKEMEDRLLELDRRIRASKPPRKFAYRCGPLQAQAIASAAGLQHGGHTAHELLQDLANSVTRPPPSRTSTTTTANVVSQPPAYADDALAYLNQFILPPLPMREGVTPPIGSAIPRTYTTGDPTYSVSGIDVTNATGNTGATSIPGKGPINFNKAAMNLPPGVAGMHSLGSVTVDRPAGTEPGAVEPLPAVKQVLANAVSAVTAAGGFGSNVALPRGFDIAAQVVPNNGASSSWTFASPGPTSSQSALSNQLTGTSAQTLLEGSSSWAAASAQMAANRLWDWSLRLEEAEAAMMASRRECEGFEKKLAGLVKKNRRLALSGLH